MGKCIKCELAGVRSFSYSCFEGLKAKDVRLEPVLHYNDNEKNPQGFAVIIKLTFIV